MSLFTVTDSALGTPIDGAKVVARLVSNNSIVAQGFTNAAGQIDLVLAPNTAHTVLAYKTGAYDGVRQSIQNQGGVLYPASVGLTKVTQRQLNLTTCQGTPATPLRSQLVVKNAANATHATSSTDVAGNAGFTLPADLTGWKLYVTAPGLDGVVVPLDKIDLIGTLLIVLGPVIGPDE